MTISEQLQSIRSSKQSIKTAIEAKGVSVGDIPFAQYADKILNIGDLEEAPENDVNFYDYDGFRVASYTIGEAKALTALPTPPTHEGLIFQEWNWTLEDIKTYDRQYADIGANYVTTDGKTHIKVLIDSLNVGIQIAGLKGTLYVDWGDGNQESSHTFKTYRSTHNFSHTFNTLGYKNITLRFEQSAEDGSYGLSNMNDTNVCFGLSIYEILIGNYFNAGGVGTLQNINKCYLQISIPIYMNSSIFCGQTLFKQISFPRNSILEVGYQYFSYVTGKICFPKVIKSLGASNYVFYQSITNRYIIPENMDDITISTGAYANFQASIVSLPMSTKFASFASGNYIHSSCLAYIDVVQGWSPNVSMSFSSSKMWTKEYLVRFFNKLGTTTNAITLTFGSTNLNRLTAEEKAIATNKGYTLA